MGRDLVAGAERVCGRGCAVREPAMLVRASGGVALFPEACVVPSAACTQLACRPPVRVCVFVAGGAGACIGEAGRDPRCAIHPFIVALGARSNDCRRFCCCSQGHRCCWHTQTHTHTSHPRNETKRASAGLLGEASVQRSASSACRHGDAGRPDGRPFRTDSRTDRVATAAGGGFAAAVRVAAVRDVCRVDRVMFNQVESSARSNAVWETRTLCVRVLPALPEELELSSLDVPFLFACDLCRPWLLPQRAPSCPSTDDNRRQNGRCCPAQLAQWHWTCQCLSPYEYTV